MDDRCRWSLVRSGPMTTPALMPATDAELARLDELVFVLHAVTAGMPVMDDSLVPAVRYGLVRPRQSEVGLTPRGERVLAIAHGEIAAGMHESLQPCGRRRRR
jgi:hypothetical protein